MKKIYYYSLFILLIIILSLIVGYVLGRVYKTREIVLKEQQGDIIATSNEKEIVNPRYYAPRIDSAKVFKDSLSGYNLQIATSYFRFTPEKFGQPIAQNSGYAYVYVNNQKAGRAYGEWLHLPETLFKTGTNTITITLNSNNHQVWWSKQGKVEAKYILETRLNLR